MILPYFLYSLAKISMERTPNFGRGGQNTLIHPLKGASDHQRVFSRTFSSFREAFAIPLRLETKFRPLRPTLANPSGRCFATGGETRITSARRGSRAVSSAVKNTGTARTARVPVLFTFRESGAGPTSAAVRQTPPGVNGGVTFTSITITTRMRGRVRGCPLFCSTRTSGRSGFRSRRRIIAVVTFRFPSATRWARSESSTSTPGAGTRSGSRCSRMTSLSFAPSPSTPGAASRLVPGRVKTVPLPVRPGASIAKTISSASTWSAGRPPPRRPARGTSSSSGSRGRIPCWGKLSQHRALTWRRCP
mmetsp:Transcript_4361/g.12217  ORF Transcript_4361/g.12217 Transcript_4361/m.12217 type:complete len:305 (+) Transcript_4361:334-1248(+)